MVRSASTTRYRFCNNSQGRGTYRPEKDFTHGSKSTVYPQRSKPSYQVAMPCQVPGRLSQAEGVVLRNRSRNRRLILREVWVAGEVAVCLILRCSR